MMSSSARVRSLRQRHFPERRKLIRSSTKPTRTRRRAEKQSTLTQLNYIVPLAYEQDDSNLSEIEQDEHIGSAPRKRRKLECTTPDGNRKQSTLTQWEWLEQDHFSDDHGSESERESDSRPTNSLELGDQGPDAFTKERPTTSPGLSPPRDDDSQAAKVPRELFTTPKKAIKIKIPSSQSPEATPLSGQETPGSERLLPNSNGSPDARKRTAISPLYSRGESTRASRVDMSIEQEGLCGDDHSPSHAPEVNETQDLLEAVCSPTNISHFTDRKSNAASITARVYDPGRSSQATTVDVSQPSPSQARKESWPEEHAADSRQVRFHGSFSSPPLPRPPSPMAPESQLPFTLASDIDSADCTPLPPLQHSEDLVTVSQLLPESMRDNV